MADTATRLAEWADRLVPSEIELQMAGRALTDTVAVAMAGLAEPVAGLLDQAPEAERWATIAHVLDYDDLHIPSTSHISVVCVPATLVAGGSARAYLAGAGVMARVGRILGWPHYSEGWHATGTAGALGAAVCAGVGYGLDQAGLSRAIALAVPGAGGVQRAFGTMGKSLQVGFAAGAGVRAAQLARAGATADTSAVDQWLALLRGRPADPARVDGELADPAAIPGGLAIKVFPCCYALQRPICALAQLGRLDPAAVQRIEVRTPAAAVQPLIHHQPDNGLQGKFSLEYGIAAALLDQRTGFASFTDKAVRRPSAQQLLRRVTAEHPGPAAEHPGAAAEHPGAAAEHPGAGPADRHPGASPAAGLADDDDLLAGTFEADVHLLDGSCRQVSLAAPLGSPSRPLTAGGLRDKVADCCGDRAADVLAADWQTALPLLRDAYQRRLPHDRQRSP